MKALNSMQCNLCLSNNIENIYTPINSLESLGINICSDCGLVFADKKFKSEKLNDQTNFRNLSCDADYSSVRVGKAQMVPRALKLFDDLIDDRGLIKRILDMSSARGHFANKAIEYFQSCIIDCIEPDKYMTTEYIFSERINIFNGKYKAFENNHSYDLIYSCHSLEHYRNPLENLKWIEKKLDINGFFYIEVPNIEAINNSKNIDEFFYDMHLYYFDKKTLCRMLNKANFEVLAENSDNGNLAFLCKKSEQIINSTYTNNYLENKNLIEAYRVNIEMNRHFIKNNSERLSNFLNDSQNEVMIVGAGRILDFLMKYCSVNLPRSLTLVDNFLSEATDTLYGLSVHKLINVKDFKNINAILILAKTSSIALMKEVEANWPEAKIYTLDDFIKDYQ
jgi:hypothetical protein